METIFMGLLGYEKKTNMEERTSVLLAMQETRVEYYALKTNKIWIIEGELMLEKPLTKEVCFINFFLKKRKQHQINLPNKQEDRKGEREREREMSKAKTLLLTRWRKRPGRSKARHRYGQLQARRAWRQNRHGNKLIIIRRRWRS
jgi:hypothetical protein